MDIEVLTKQVQQVSDKYAQSHGIDRQPDWYVLKLQEELGELIQSYLMMTGQARSKGKSSEEIKQEFDKEVADVLCHVLLLAAYNNVDLKKMIEEKWLVWNK
jgi:NTP pyrophosphatase (non-canonical NTP hydrolase)